MSAKVTNDKRNVSTTRGVAGGYFFTAPVGTDLPTDFKSELNEAFVCAGFISEDGFSEGLDGSSENITDINGDNVHTYSDKRTETVALTLIEMSEEALGIQYGHKNINSENEDYFVVDHNWGNADEELSCVLELVLKNGRRWRKVIPTAKVTELGEFTGNSTTVTGREVTLTYQVDEKGSTAKDYIEKLKDPLV